MDLSSLERSVKALETSLDSIESWLTVSTVLVVIGLIIEYWHPLKDFIEALHKRPPFPWKESMEIVGGVLVTIGVAGELWFQSRASNLETLIRSDSHQIEAFLKKEVDDAQRDAAELNLARVQIEQSMEWRHLPKGAAKELCASLPPQTTKSETVAITVMHDPEPAQFATEIADAIGGCLMLPSLKSLQRGPMLDLGSWSFPIRFGVYLEFPDSDSGLAKSVAAILKKHGIDATVPTKRDPEYAKSENRVILVGPRTIPNSGNTSEKIKP
jgi:hypothetical protein